LAAERSAERHFQEPLLSKPLIYLILGAAGSGRREILADLVEGGLGESDRAAILVSEDDTTAIPAKTAAAVERWKLVPAPEPGLPPGIDGSLPSGATHVFFVTDGRHNPVDQVEAFKEWLSGQPAELAHVICVVNCSLAEKHPKLLVWFDACIHFSDVVLLSHREGVANKWMSDFKTRYADLYYPCHFELVKAGRVHNPALVLEPRALRMSHIFDEDLNWVLTNEEGEVVEDEDETAEDEDLQATPEVDPYFERLEGGRRVKEIPDIAAILDKARGS
jgi:hypothetical protein